ncbi:Condensin complex subunit 1 [Brachionus plicatilis]|uniref:Condensin complex subunit 1 n=1 Tax=Brachionus plicatilis TaxID=10195 RepID=A0A3M7QTY6_BRAPC|nr:Condensin complex subunit 1 [Brachionus plicatilis]
MKFEYKNVYHLGSVIQIFWKMFSDMEKPPLTRLHSIRLLTMIIKRIPGKGKANIESLIDFGLKLPSQTEATDLEMLICSETCLALSYTSEDVSTKQLTQQDPSSVIRDNAPKSKKTKNYDEADQADASYVQPRLQFKNEPFKMANTHQLFDRLVQIINCQLTNLSTSKWTPMAESAISCIFKLADNPISIVENLIQKLIDQMPPFKMLISAVPQPDDSNFKIDSLVLSRYFNLIGIVATKLLVFLNQFIVCELKRRKMCKENKENQKNSRGSKSKRKSMRANKSLGRQSLGGDANLDEDLGLQTTEAEDTELLFIENVIEHKVAVSNNEVRSLLAQQLPTIVCILKEQSKHADSLVLACAMAFVRLMALSQKLCSENLQLLFTLMEKSPNAEVRSQLIVGIGDLVYRFPNALEPWTSHLYLPLRDTKSPAVRMNTIRVLSHLILKELIKTRGQIFEIALCTIDENTQISSLAKLFFSELSQRNNGLVIYNAMPDIISQLSGGAGTSWPSGEIYAARQITEDAFRQIVTYLFTFIRRDKQCETLIEKLCHGFRQANIGERKCRDLVFCLSKVQLSENGIKKLKETFRWYADKLIYQSVYDTFKQTILRNARKLPMLKNETKLLIDELEKQMDDVKQKGLSDEPNNDASLREEKDSASESEHVSTGAKKLSRNCAPRGKNAAQQFQKVSKKNSKVNVTRNRRKVIDSSSEQDDDSSEEESDGNSSSDSE